MNDRFESLAEEAMVHVPGQTGLHTRVFSLEKFAELIVRECARAIINDRRLNDVRSAANGCVRTINEHFGVEE